MSSKYEKIGAAVCVGAIAFFLWRRCRKRNSQPVSGLDCPIQTQEASSLKHPASCSSIYCCRKFPWLRAFNDLLYLHFSLLQVKCMVTELSNKRLELCPFLLKPQAYCNLLLCLLNIQPV